jgi:hypothetical protein
MKNFNLILLSLIFVTIIPSENNTDTNDDIEITSVFDEDDENILDQDADLFMNEDIDLMDEDNDGDAEMDEDGQEFAFVSDNIVQDSPATNEQSNLILLDQIEAVVYGQDAEIITRSDIERPALGGGFRTKEEIVFEQQVFLDAKKHHIPQDEETIDAYLAQIQREHNLSAQELEQIFTGSGYTIQEGRQQLQLMQMVNTMLDLKIRSNLVIPRKDVEEYHAAHPTIIEATYTLERAFVPQSKKISASKQYELLIKYAQTGKGIKGISWSESFTINHSDIAQSKQFIYGMKVGQISLPEPVEGGFELFKLVEKTPEQIKSLEESYREIVDILRRPKYEELMEKYREDLANSTWVKYY